MPIEDFDLQGQENMKQLHPILTINTCPIGFRHSPTIGKLTEALAKANLSFEAIKKETENPYFKSQYADLSTLIAATRGALSKNGLVVIQTPRTKEGLVFVTTALLHTSNEWISEDLELRPAKSDPQGCGSAMTYARRYAYQSILNIAGEVDDDGNAASGKTAKGSSKPSIDEAEEQFQERSGGQRASVVMVNAFEAMFKTSGKTEKQLTDVLRVRYSAERPDQLTKEELQELVKWAAGREPLEDTIKTSIAATGRAVQEPLSSNPPQSTPERLNGLEYVPMKLTKVEFVSKGKARWIVEGVDTQGEVWSMTCWDKKLGTRLAGAVGKACILGIKTAEKEGKTYYNVSAIEEIVGEMQQAPDYMTDEDIPF